MRSISGSPALLDLTFAEFKAAVEAFDPDDTDVFAAVDAVPVAVEAQQSATALRPFMTHSPLEQPATPE
jgi:hypothetical protein